MPAEYEHLTIGSLPAKYDRTYAARDRESDAVYKVNLARLQCTCSDWVSQRAGFSPTDARRVCAHIYDKLYVTKAERTFDPLLRLFIRYRRNMLSVRIVEDELGVLILGQPFGPKFVRAIGLLVGGKPVLATYNVHAQEWSDGETDLGAELSAGILERMRAVFPDTFG